MAGRRKAVAIATAFLYWVCGFLTSAEYRVRECYFRHMYKITPLYYKTISVLHNYCAEQQFDKAVVCNRLRLFFKNAYYTNRMSKEEISSTMYRLALNIDFPENLDIDLWGSMYYLDDYYSLAKEGIIPWESFDFAFFSYLDNSTPFDPDLI